MRPPVWDAPSRAAASQAATEALTLFARPDVTYGVWWRDLAPRMSPAAQRAYVDVDPRNVPVRKVTGSARLVDATTPYLAGLEIPTDAGVYSVLLSRSSADARWLVERIGPKS